MVFTPEALKGAFEVGNGPSDPSKFMIVIPPCAAMGGALGIGGTILGAAGGAYLSIMTDSVNIPGKQITTTPFTMYGTETKMPYGIAYEELNVSFNCTNNMFERRYFDWWSRLISDPTNNYWNYYDDYVTNIKLYKMPPGGGESALGFLEAATLSTYVMTIEEAYPVSINSQELSYDAEGVLKLNVTFAYRRYRTAEDIIVGSSSGLPTDAGQFVGGTRPTPPASSGVNNEGSTEANKSGNKP